MASLLDLGPLTEEVEIRGVPLTVRGLTSAHLFKLFSQFPNLPQSMAEIGADAGATARMLELVPDMFARIIAMATTPAGIDQAAVEAKAKELGAADQLTIMAAVQRLSMPQGFIPFVEQMTRLMGIPTTPPSSLDGQANSSPASFNGGLQTDSPGMTRGISPPAN